MKCVYCGRDDTDVLESRIIESGNAIRRRRSCKKCKRRFTTVERVKKTNVLIVKKDGSREAFDTEKVRRGVLRAVEKRPVALTLVDDIVHEVESEVLKKGSREVPSSLIGKSILKRLKKIDRVAWLRFASVYLEFEDIRDFEKAIEKIS